ncbi:DUF2637 domain-containing protein [Actinomadura barringtoniae]|uniref:DUF2637 domain-containing protein n=1 Tax=Actinomadura barringtoniae TaxID=1427535 RepID=A0A939PR64_9ACTN|nr:DUF2637 domain-containing protein [Actinomadura barringtoniae]MBO2453649.1 DUF2637 domain-containing protein [Actinomadura barringtoniae]
MTDILATPPPSFGHHDQPASRARALSEHEFSAVAVVVACVVVLGLLGFVNSFAAVEHAARPSFGWLAWTVPLGVDLGIAIFAALDIVLARLDMRVRWLRLLPWTLTAATVYLNVADETTMFGAVAHAVLPCLWVLAVEIGSHVVRIRAGIQAGTRMDGIRASRWVLAPWPTLKLWRRMVLWEIRSYPEALGRERDRVLSLTDLQDTYGRWTWRRNAPRRVRALYRLGELAPSAASAVSDGPEQPSKTTSGTTPETAPKTARGRSARSSRSTSRTGARNGRGRKTRTAPDVDDLMPLGWRISADLAERGKTLTRDALATELREAGSPAGNERVGALLSRLKSEAPDDPTNEQANNVPVSATEGSDAR